MPHRTLTISAENTFTSFIVLRGGDTASISVSGSFSGTVVLQRSFDGLTAYRDVANPDGTVGWTSPIETSYFADESSYLRIGIKTGGFVSGNATVRIGTDRAQPFTNQPATVPFQGTPAFVANTVLRNTSTSAFAGGGGFSATL